MQIISDILSTLTDFGIALFQLAAVVLMIISCVFTLWKFVRQKNHTVIELRKWVNVSLLFILCSEVLSLIKVHQFTEVLTIFFIVLIHGAISVLSNWEMSRELKLHAEQEEQVHKHFDINL